MTMSTYRRVSRALPLLLLLGFQACGLEDVGEIPELSGPSELGNALTLRANPDWVVADNTSVSDVVATLRGPNGQPIGGRTILFTITDAGGAGPAMIGELATINGQVIASGQAATAVTNGSGVAQVRFSAPARTDILSATSVLIAARPQGDDANAAIYRTVRVEVVPAEPRLFPPNPGNAAPTCSFVTQPAIPPNPDGTWPAGMQILFQSTSSDAPPGRIVRYEWDFGDNTGDLKPDTNHAFGAADTYEVVHTVVDNNGAATPCSRVFRVK
jgi:PKD domain-containing protein